MANAEEKDINSWLDASRYDLQTAKALLKSRRYIYVLFMCQQSLEKLLKAHVTAQTREFPPRIHNLVRLAELTSFEFSQEEKTHLERLSLYYLQSRYPPEVQALAKTVNSSMATAHLKQTEALWKRLRRQLTRKKSSGKQ
jgi:HEPN domain-containing protein